VEVTIQRQAVKKTFIPLETCSKRETDVRRLSVFDVWVASIDVNDQKITIIVQVVNRFKTRD
jgi:hypothetical protein